MAERATAEPRDQAAAEDEAGEQQATPPSPPPPEQPQLPPQERVFDAVVCGTGLDLSLLAGALARAGQRVLHMDANDYYGEETATMPLDQLLDWAEERLPTGLGPQGGRGGEGGESDAKPSGAEASAGTKPSLAQQLIALRKNAAEAKAAADAEAAAAVAAAAAESGDKDSNSNNNDGDKETSDKKPDDEVIDLRPDDNIVRTDLRPNASLVTLVDMGDANGIPERVRQKRRDFNLDLNPKVLLGSGNMVDIMINCNVGRYMEFKTVDSVHFVEAELQGEARRAVLSKVPCSKGDVFKASMLSALEKRLLMRFLQFCTDWGMADLGEEAETRNERELAQGRSLHRPQNKKAGGGKAGFDVTGFEDRPFREFLEHSKIPPRLQDVLIYAIALQSQPAEELTARDGLRALYRHMVALGRYGTTAFLTPMYGTSEVPQSFCRLCAVYGGIYKLRVQAKQLLTNERTGEVCGFVDTENNLCACSRFAAAAHLLPTTRGPLPAVARPTDRRIVTRLSLLSGYILPEESGRAIAVIPPNTPGLGNATPIQLLQLDHSMLVVPEGVVVVYASTVVNTGDTTDQEASAMLNDALRMLLATAEASCATAAAAEAASQAAKQEAEEKKAQSEPKLEPATQKSAEPEPEPEPKAQPQPDNQQPAKSEPEPVPESEPEPQADPELSPDLEPQALQELIEFWFVTHSRPIFDGTHLEAFELHMRGSARHANAQTEAGGASYSESDSFNDTSRVAVCGEWRYSVSFHDTAMQACYWFRRLMGSVDSFFPRPVTREEVAMATGETTDAEAEILASAVAAATVAASATAEGGGGGGGVGEGGVELELSPVRALGVVPDGKVMRYGTAGFRDDARMLDAVMARAGMIAAVRSCHVGGKAVGVMVTASHNPVKDNGVKIVDPDGGMLDQAWEPHAEALANASTEDLAACLRRVVEETGTALFSSSAPRPVVVVGMDTRPHSAALAEHVRLGVGCVSGRCIDAGVLTTPMLHFAVYDMNTCGHWDANRAQKAYMARLAGGFASLLATEPGSDHSATLVVDAACGVGSVALEDLEPELAERLHDGVLQIDIRNKAGDGELNHECGAEHTQKTRAPPRNVSAADDTDKRMCAFDGDADRIVFHYFSAEDAGGDGASGESKAEGSDAETWHLLDGDKIAVLLTRFLSAQLQQMRAVGDEADAFKVCVVQTAYANGASTQFLRDAGIEVRYAKTGVKYLHAVAHKFDTFDIGVYFEANGHGTVLFSERVLAAAQSILDGASSNSSSSSGGDSGDSNVDAGTETQVVAARRLLACAEVLNPCVGDAISDMLLVEAVLRLHEAGEGVAGGLSAQSEWNGLYSDLPSRMIKVSVPDRTLIRCTADETRVIEPQALQDALDAEMERHPHARCFVRPSGTEDVVRVYAEAYTLEHADALISVARAAVLEHVG